jgi:hypothetical protein
VIFLVDVDEHSPFSAKRLVKDERSVTQVSVYADKYPNDGTIGGEYFKGWSIPDKQLDAPARRLGRSVEWSQLRGAETTRRSDRRGDERRPAGAAAATYR